MKRNLLGILLVCTLLLPLAGIGQTQIIAPPPADSQVPGEILMGLIGKYTVMVQQYQALIAQGGAPDSVVQLRLAAKIILDDEEMDSGLLDRSLTELAKVAVWIKANIFARYPNMVKVDLSGSLGGMEVLSTATESIVVFRDEAVFSVLPPDAGVVDVAPIDMPPVDLDFLTSLEELQEQIDGALLSRLLGADMEYDGLELTPKGWAHVVRLTFTDTGEIVTLGVLDETWELCKFGYDAPLGGSSIILVIENIELVASALPDTTFAVDTSILAELPYEEFLAVLDLKVLSAALTGVPVAADLSVSLPEVRQGGQVVVSSNGLDAEDAESDLDAKIQYRAPNGSWTPLEAVYFGTAPLGHWEATFVPPIDGLPGSYDFSVTYTDATGVLSDPLELLAALTVIAVPPEVVDVSPADRERNVPVVSQVVVTFSQGMDTASVESAFSLADSAGQAVSGIFEWTEGHTLAFKPDQELAYNGTYHARLLGTAAGLNTATLDTDMDGISEGSPEDDLSWRFSTERYPVLAVEPSQPIDALPGDFITVDIVAQSVTQLNSFAFAVNVNPEVLNTLKVERASFAMWRPRPKIIEDVDIWQPTAIDDEQGLITIAADSTRKNGVSGTGVIATLTFQAIGVGESPLEFQDVSFINALGEDISPELRHGSVQVMEFDPWDANEDGVVNILDFIIIQTDRGASTDVNGDGVTNILDMVAAAGDVEGPLTPPPPPGFSMLGGNFPNPFNPETWIPYQLARSAHVVIRIYSPTGQVVRSLDLGYKGAGRYITKATAAHWDGTNEDGERVASGIYYYTIKAGDFSAVKKMVVSQ